MLVLACCVYLSTIERMIDIFSGRAHGGPDHSAGPESTIGYQQPIGVRKRGELATRSAFKSGDSSDSSDWRDAALCAQTDPEAFFPEKGGSADEARKVCANCDVSEECLKYAFNNNELYGVWGGLTERERRKLRRRQPK